MLNEWITVIFILMEERSIFLLAILLLFWTLSSIIGSLSVAKAYRYDSKRKRVHLILVWLIPFFWSGIIILMTRKLPKPTDDGYTYREAGFKNYTRYTG
jgi:ABC-type dipeptide/oligopeptide/nickel transport system permease component